MFKSNNDPQSTYKVTSSNIGYLSKVTEPSQEVQEAAEPESDSNNTDDSDDNIDPSETRNEDDDEVRFISICSMATLTRNNRTS